MIAGTPDSAQNTGSIPQTMPVDQPTPTQIPSIVDAKTATPDHPALKRTRRGFLRDILEMAALVIVIYSFVNLTTARAIVEGPSMQPNFYTGQLLIVNLFSYFFNAPARGDVVVLHNPSGSCKDTILENEQTIVLLPSNASSPCDDLIKRVIGLPNDKIVIKNGRVSINGTQLEEPYISAFCDHKCDGQWQLTGNQYFVLGDNRNNSYDSSAFGPIDKGLIVGRAWIRYWPAPVIGLIPQPTYIPSPVSQSQ